MKLSFPFKSSRLDYDQLTAAPQTVRKGKKFIGIGSAEPQDGVLETRSKVTYDLPLNGRYDIPPGIHDESSIVRQTSLTVMNGATVYPTADMQTVSCKNKYMGNDVYVAPLTGLVPGNIKKDVVIMGVRGTYEGYS